MMRCREVREQLPSMAIRLKRFSRRRGSLRADDSPERHPHGRRGQCVLQHDARPDASLRALAARQLGWLDIALMCTNELGVPGAMPRCVRVLVHWNTEKAPEDIVHVYIKEAAALRPDRSTLPPVDWNELESWIASTPTPPSNPPADEAANIPPQPSLLQPNDIVAAIDVQHLTGHAAGHRAEQIRGRLCPVPRTHVAPETRLFDCMLAHLIEVGDAGRA